MFRKFGNCLPHTVSNLQLSLDNKFNNNNKTQRRNVAAARFCNCGWLFWTSYIVCMYIYVYECLTFVKINHNSLDIQIYENIIAMRPRSVPYNPNLHNVRIIY